MSRFSSCSVSSIAALTFILVALLAQHGCFLHDGRCKRLDLSQRCLGPLLHLRLPCDRDLDAVQSEYALFRGSIVVSYLLGFKYDLNSNSDILWTWMSILKFKSGKILHKL